jgi:hypothetical protein
MRRGTTNNLDRKYSLDIPVATILSNPKDDWLRMANGGKRIRTARKLDVDWKMFNQDDYLLSHATIVSSVSVEDNGYYIDPVCAPLVNNNGNAWTSQVLLSTFKSFVGGENYLEHVQVPELSKGKILDAIARPVKYENNGKKANVYFVDILVATHRKHGGLVRKIEAGELDTMSMGCLASYVTCSKCGKVLGDGDMNCQHLSREIMTKFRDENGVERIVAELCGRMSKGSDGNWSGDPDSVKFIEASWVAKPAFTGAVLNHYVSELPKASALMNLSTEALELTMQDMFKMRVADRNGMIVLNVVRNELLKRKREEMVNRVARSRWV